MRQRPNGEERQIVMRKATETERYLIMARDIARCRTPERAKEWLIRAIEGRIRDMKNGASAEDMAFLERELLRVQEMSAEDLYAELGIKP